MVRAQDAEAAVAAIIKGEVDYTVHLGVAFSIIVGTVAFTRLVPLAPGL